MGTGDYPRFRRRPATAPCYDPRASPASAVSYAPKCGAQPERARPQCNHQFPLDDSTPVRALPSRQGLDQTAHLRPRRASGTQDPDLARRAGRHPQAAAGRLQGLRRRRRGARPAARHRAQGFRHRHRRDAGTGQAAVPPRVHHRPALPPGQRARRPGNDRGVDLPRTADRRRRLRRARPAAARQRVRLAGRGRAAPRLHLQRAVLRPGQRGSLGLRRRRARRAGAAHAPDRRPVTRYREDPVRMLRAARLAAKLGLTIEKKTAAPIPELAPLLENVPPARLFDEMEKLLLSGHAAGVGEEPAPAGPAPRRAAAARRDRRTAAGPALHRAGAGQYRRARARRQVGDARVPVRHAALARSAGELERGQGARRAPDAGAVRGDGQGAGAAGAAPRDSAPLRSGDQGNLGAAAALRAARRAATVPSAGASALSRRLRFCPIALRQRRDGRRARRSGRLVGAVSSTPSRPSATNCCGRTRRRRKSAARAAAAASAARATNPGGAASEPATSSGES